MTLPEDLLKDFANVVSPREDTTKEEKTVYGTVRIVNGETYIQFDGAVTNTPVTNTVEVKEGDRVLALLKDRKAIITGNVTTPIAKGAATFFQPSTDPPSSTNRKIGDIWFQTDLGNKMLKWTSNNEWKEATFDYQALSVAQLSSISANLGSINAGSMNIGNGKFVVTDQGDFTATNGTLTGKIVANSGAIANWNIIKGDANRGTTADGGHIYNHGLYSHAKDASYEYEIGMKADTGDSSSGMLAYYVKRIPLGAAWTDANATDMFFVRNNGSLYARNADISGKITASNGTVGNWTIAESSIAKSFMLNGDQYTVILRTAGGATSHDVSGTIRPIEVFKTVNPGTSSATSTSQFYVGSDGYLMAQNGSFKGEITATSGSIKDLSISACWIADTLYFGTASNRPGISGNGSILYLNAAYAGGTTTQIGNGVKSYGPFDIYEGSITVNQNNSNSNAAVLVKHAFEGTDTKAGRLQISVGKNFGLWYDSYNRWTLYDNGTKVVIPPPLSLSSLSVSGASAFDGQVQIKSRLLVGPPEEDTYLQDNYVDINAGNSGQMIMSLHADNGTSAVRVNSDDSGNVERSGSLAADASGNFGLYDRTYSKWLIVADSTGTVTIPNATTVLARMTFSNAPVVNNNIYYCSKNTDGTNVPLVGWSSGNNMWVGHYTFASRSNRINLGATIDKLYVYNSSGSTVLLSTQVSDRRLKHDISDLAGAKELIMGLQAKEFRYNGEEGDRKHYGFVAQDVRPLISEDSAILAYNPTDIETGEYDPKDESTFEYSMSYTELIAPMIQVIQEQEKRIAELEKLVKQCA